MRLSRRRMTDLLVAKYDYGELEIDDPEEVCPMVERLMQTQTRPFWDSDWTLRIRDSKAVQDKLGQKA